MLYELIIIAGLELAFFMFGYRLGKSCKTVKHESVASVPKKISKVIGFKSKAERLEEKRKEELRELLYEIDHYGEEFINE